MSASALFEIDHVSGGYGSGLVVRAVSLSVARGEAMCLLGRNGVGKIDIGQARLRLAEARIGHSAHGGGGNHRPATVRQSCRRPDLLPAGAGGIRRTHRRGKSDIVAGQPPTRRFRSLFPGVSAALGSAGASKRARCPAARRSCCRSSEAWRRVPMWR